MLYSSGRSALRARLSFLWREAGSVLDHVLARRIRSRCDLSENCRPWSSLEAPSPVSTTHTPSGCSHQWKIAAHRQRRTHGTILYGSWIGSFRHIGKRRPAVVPATTPCCMTRSHLAMGSTYRRPANRVRCLCPRETLRRNSPDRELSKGTLYPGESHLRWSVRAPNYRVHAAVRPMAVSPEVRAPEGRRPRSLRLPSSSDDSAANQSSSRIVPEDGCPTAGSAKVSPPNPIAWASWKRPRCA